MGIANGRDFATNSTLGYHALVNRRIGSDTAPAQCDAERSRILKEFMETWAKTLAHAGIPANKIYAHIAFTDQGLNDSSTKISYAQLVDFATPDVVFSKFSLPGFSTYPMGDAVDKVYKEVASRGSPPWISAEVDERGPKWYVGRSYYGDISRENVQSRNRYGEHSLLGNGW